MPNVKVSLDELCDAYAMNNEEIEHYLDLETGELVVWMDPILTGERDEEFEDELEEGERYLQLPKIESTEAYELMAEFLEVVNSSALRNGSVNNFV